MKILHLGKYSLDKRGGIETATAVIAEFQARHGDCVRILCFADASRQTAFRGVLINEAKISKIIYSQPISVQYFIRGVLEVLRADIVHLHAPNFLAFFYGFFWGYGRGTGRTLSRLFPFTHIRGASLPPFIPLRPFPEKN